jgi:4-amino-4-deoxy-L-arabinose transferase-like glycosyltransferase
LQRQDWAPDVSNSAAFFMSTPPLAAGCRRVTNRSTGRLASTSGSDGAARDRPSPERRFAAWLLVIATIALALRLVFPAADPPWQTTVGVVWHDEGAWVHNARNRALFGAWTQDAWNPMFIAPVFTVLEYWSFALFGVGIRQARLVSELAGFSSVILLAFGVRRLAGREAGLIAGALVATNYVCVMWNRAALMEATMVAFIVAAWYCYVRAQDRAWWGALAGACALLAYFSKAAAVFFVAALALEAAVATVRPSTADGPASRAAARATLLGLAGLGVIVLAAFLAPNWTEYRFYNWQISVTASRPTICTRSWIGSRGFRSSTTFSPACGSWSSWVLPPVSALSGVGAACRRASDCSSSGSDSGRSSSSCTMSATSAGLFSSSPRSWRWPRSSLAGTGRWRHPNWATSLSVGLCWLCRCCCSAPT